MTRRIARALRPNAGADRDRGMSLVEVLVGIGLFGMLGAVLLGVVLSTSRVTDDTRELTNVNEEARLAVERLTRELRQANEIVAVHLPANANDSTALTFWTDFNGNGAKDLTAADPEVLTYRWQPTTGQLTLTANDSNGTAVTRPLLSSNVSAFSITLNSSQWQYDANHDGTTTWQELDALPPVGVGNNNGGLDGEELKHIDLVGVTMTVLDGPHAQTYTTQVDLRNRNLN
jgi:type II secretory pathway pseudopilin PulG